MKAIRVVFMIAATVLSIATGAFSGPPEVEATAAIRVVEVGQDDEAAVAGRATVVQPASETKLVAGAPVAAAGFGQSAAMQGGFVVIGAPRDSVGGQPTGAAYVFRFDGTRWKEEARLTARDGAARDSFGQSVAIDGDLIIVGASGNDQVGFNSGAAYVFRYDGSGWNEEAKLVPATPRDVLFGFSVAVDGDTIAIGAPYTYSGGEMTSSGSVYLFGRDGASWKETARLATRLGGGPVLRDLFGWAVALSGNTLVVGAYLGEAAYVFDYDGVRWQQVARLSGGDTQRGDRFGWSVAIDGSTAVVGAVQDDDAGNNAGAAYVFEFDGVRWSEQAKLAPGRFLPGSRFGWSVTVQADTLVVGAREGKGNADRTEAGAAYLYTRARDGRVWALAGALYASDADALDHFGAAVTLEAGTVVVGAPDDDGGAPGSGSAYAYTLFASGVGDGDDAGVPVPRLVRRNREGSIQRHSQVP